MTNTRRSFLKQFSGGLAATALPAFAYSNNVKTEILKNPWKPQRRSVNDTIQVAVIGCGIMGYAHSRMLVNSFTDAKLVAACDLYDGRLERIKEKFGKDIFTTRDYKEILDRDDIDAVVVATSDHWHDHISIDAMKAGKAVYCEKPMVHRIEEGQAVIDTQNKTKQVFQVGSQRASSILYAKAKELYEQGVIGDLIMAETWNDRHSSNGAWQYSIPTDASPETVDWGRFIGDAPKRGYDPVRFFRWRNYQDYGTGVAGDLFVHLFTGLHMVLDSAGPDRIFSTGGLRYWKDGRDVPDVMIACLDYPERKTHPAFNLQIRVNFVDGKGGGSGLVLVGTDGAMEIKWGSIRVIRNPLDPTPTFGGWDTYNTFTEAQQKEFAKWHAEKYPTPSPKMMEPEVLEYKTPEGYSDNVAHFQNFFDCMRTGKPVVEDALFGLQAAGPALAVNKSYFDRKVIEWDAVNGRVLNS